MGLDHTEYHLYISYQLGDLAYHEAIRNIAQKGNSLKAFYEELVLKSAKNKKLEEKPIYLHTMPYEKISLYDLVGIRTSKYK